MIISHSEQAGFVAAFMQRERSQRVALERRGWQEVPTTRALRLAATATNALYDCQQYQKSLDDAGRAQFDVLTTAMAEKTAASRATASTLAVPAPVGETFLPFQLAGIEFLRDCPEAILGDEMGLGKTVQVIGLGNLCEDIDSVLVVCPASLKLNWRREFERWSTRGWTIAVAGAGKKQEALLPTANVVIVNYELLDKLAPVLTAREWGLIGFDEAHYLKNRHAKRTNCAFGVTEAQALAKMAREHVSGDSYRDYTYRERIDVLRSRLPDFPALRKELAELQREGLRGRRRVFITGTPIPNRPVELWPILQQVAADGLGANWERYVTHFCAGSKNRWGGWETSGASNLAELQDELRMHILVRRRKAEVLTDLPAKRHQLVELEATGTLGRIAKREADADARHRSAMATIKARMAAATAADNKADYDAAVTQMREQQGVAFGEMAALRHELAVAKLPHVLDHLHALLDDSDEKIVVWAHHRDVLDGIAAEFPGAAVITGDTPTLGRQAQVDRFQNDAACRLFVGSITAAGVGITLTASSAAVFAEQDWSPGTMQQAEDRCHRIGQQSAVLVQVLVVDGSLDAKFARTLVKKGAVIESALG